MTADFETIEQIACPRHEIAAYLDGELDGAAEELFARHLASCAICAEKLNEQKRLLHTLDFAFSPQSQDLVLPKDFARRTIVRAESNVMNLRSAAERRRALFNAVALFAFGVLIGIIGKKFELLPDFVTQTAVQFAVVIQVFANFCGGFALDVVVVFRSIAGRILFHSPLATGLFAALLAASLIAASRWFKFDRA